MTPRPAAREDRSQVEARQEVEDPHLREWFGSLESQAHASQLGMWIFIAGEVLLFGALFALYGAYRGRWGESFREAAHHTDLLLSSFGTVALLAASLVVALALHAVRGERGDLSGLLLGGGAALGCLFLVFKFWEWARHFDEGIRPGAWYDFAEMPGEGGRVFFSLYYVLTGVHALHVIGGVLLLAWLAVRARRGAFGVRWHTPVELGGMYWHLVDIVWLFLWPLFYLLR